MPQQLFGTPSMGVFFDSDFAAIDDILALALLHGLQGKNECRVAIVSVSRPNLAVAAFADAVERFYRGPAGNFAQVPPVGMVTAGSPGDTSPAFLVPFQKVKADGSPVYRKEVHSEIETGDPNTLFRNYLDAQYPQGSCFVLAGPATNLAAALAFPGMKEKIREKSRYLVVSSEAQLRSDVPAARRLFAEWPAPIFVVRPDVGAALPFPGASIDKEFAEAVPDNPVADAYRAGHPMSYDAPSQALAAALYAARPKENYFQLSDPGTIAVQDDGRTVFTASRDGRHRYLAYDPAQRDRILKTYVELASAKPAVRPRFRPPVDADPPKK